MKKHTHMSGINAVTTFVMLLPFSAFAAATLKNPTPGGGKTLEEFVLMLVDIVQLVTTPILVVCLIYGGFTFLTANGSEDQLSRSKQWILWSLVGATIVLGGKVIAQAIFGTAALFK